VNVKKKNFCKYESILRLSIFINFEMFIRVTPGFLLKNWNKIGNSEVN